MAGLSGSADFARARPVPRLVSSALILLACGCVLPELELEACLLCASTGCSETYDSCFEVSSCEDLVSCALDCPSGDSECATACGTASPDGLDLALPLFECAIEACPEDCSSLAQFGGSG